MALRYALWSLRETMPKFRFRELCFKRLRAVSAAPDAHPMVTATLVTTLVDENSKSELEAIRSAFQNSTNPLVRCAILRSLATWTRQDDERANEVVSFCKRILKEDDEVVREAAASLIGQNGDLRQLDPLARLLHGDNVHAQQAAVIAICSLLGWEDPPRTSDGADEFSMMVALVLERLEALNEAIEQGKRVSR